MASKEPLWMKNVQAQDINVDVLSSIFQTRKVSRQRRPGQAATENTVILRIFLSIWLLELFAWRRRDANW
jgi:hypothetical protein